MTTAWLAVVMEDRTKVVGLLACMGLAGYGVVRLIRWVQSGPVGPDPWSAEVAAEVEAENAVPLCQHCLAPHADGVDFCPVCGGPVGVYTNMMPYTYLFAVGYTLRLGTSGRFKRSPLMILGFMLLSMGVSLVLAPFYWGRLFIGLGKENEMPPEATGLEEG